MRMIGKTQDMTDGFRTEGDALVRDFTFEDFAAALAFVNRVGEAAETANHHPDILLHGYNQVRITLTTHDAGGITDADHAMAATVGSVA
jgi:4a-hydroxytetrahydrobiopterin dehydratase